MASINSKSTKAQILEAYKQLEKEKADIQKKLQETQKQDSQATTKNQKQTTVIPTSGPSAANTPKPINPSSNTSTQVMNSMSTTTSINQVIQSLEGLQVGFGSAVSQLSEQLITEATSLNKLQTNIEQELTQLQDLHDLDTVEDDTLDTLLTTYQDSAKNFTNEYLQQEETLQQQLGDFSKEWLKEQENHQREIKIRNDNYAKEKQREEEEYSYSLELARQIDRENSDQELNQLYKVLDQTRQEQEKVWSEREKAISDQEKEYAEAKRKVEEFEEKLKAEVKKATDSGKGIGSYQAKVKNDLRNKEIEGETQNSNLRVQALEATIANNQARINSLSQQLDSTLKQVQDLAVKAIEGASNRNSFEAMKAVALEQAKTQQKSK